MGKKVCPNCGNVLKTSFNTGVLICPECETNVAVSNLIVMCPNCDHPMIKTFNQETGGGKWVCPKNCSNEVKPGAPIQEISKGSTTGVKRRWLVKGSGKMQYTVVQWTSEYQGQLFSCSCPAWTQHSPRTDCKHVLKVKLEVPDAVPKKSSEDLKALAAIIKAMGPLSPMLLKNIQVPGSEPKASVPVQHKPKTEGRKFR